jgi:hypothetical protein
MKSSKLRRYSDHSLKLSQTYVFVKERLLNLKHDSLQCRRIKADLIMCHRILNGLVDADIIGAIGCILTLLVVSRLN